ncbi:MAG TPA: ABC transporter substrate-binding protein [Candidatus Enterenecus stercoripullorum]|nr:ABC transporter substrate-binding protein [Candidatus Enterenecus stercoripullorum]
MKKVICTMLALVVLLSVLAACGGQGAPSGSGSGEGSASPAQTSDSGAYPMTFDNYGRQVTVTQKPQKVLTLGPNCTELFVALGLQDYVIGRSLINHSRGPLEEYAGGVNAIPVLNNASATREAILSSGADFIYALDWEISDTGCNIQEVAQYGMTVYVNSATTLEEQYQEILDIGKIFGVEESARQFVDDQRARIQAVQDAVTGQEPLDVLVYDSGSNGVFTCSGSNFESLLIQMAGGHNIFDDLTDQQWVTVSYEEVLARDPDVILIHDYDSPSLEEKIAEIKSNPTLAQLECVQQERFASITLESVLPGNRMAYAVERMAVAFYPEIFAD